MQLPLLPGLVPAGLSGKRVPARAVRHAAGCRRDRPDSGRHHQRLVHHSQSVRRHRSGSAQVVLDITANQDEWFAGQVFFPNSPAVTVDPTTAPPAGYALQIFGGTFELRNAGSGLTHVFFENNAGPAEDEPYVVTGVAFEQGGQIYILPQQPLTFDQCWQVVGGSVGYSGAAAVLGTAGLVGDGSFDFSCFNSPLITRIGWFAGMSSDAFGQGDPARRITGDFLAKMQFDNLCIAPLYVSNCMCLYSGLTSLNLAFKMEHLTGIGHTGVSIIESVNVTLLPVLYTEPKDGGGVLQRIRFEGSATLNSGHVVDFVWYPCTNLTIEFSGGACPDCELPQVYSLPYRTPEDGSPISHDPPNLGFATTLHSWDCNYVFHNECTCGWWNLL